MASRAWKWRSAFPPLGAGTRVPAETDSARLPRLELFLRRPIPSEISWRTLFRSGNAAVADRLPGLAEMTATVARTGTTNAPAARSRRICDALARALFCAGADTSAISFSGCEFAEPLLGLVNEIWRAKVPFPKANSNANGGQKLEEVKMERTQPGFLASERLRKILFGTHPYAQVSPSEAQVAAYERKDLEAVVRDSTRPRRDLLLVGDFDSNTMLKSAERYRRMGRKKPDSKAAAAPPNPRGRRVYLVHVSGAVQNANPRRVPRHHAESTRTG